MTRNEIAWLALLGAVVAYEAYALRVRPDVTLSEMTRRVFRTRRSVVGRYAFLVILGTSAAWYAHHVLDAAPLHHLSRRQRGCFRASRLGSAEPPAARRRAGGSPRHG